MPGAPGDFDIEIAVDALEAHARSGTSEHLAAQWRAHRDGARLPHPPAALAKARERLEAWRAVVREPGLRARVEALWSLAVRAAWESHAAVRAAAGARRDPASLRAWIDARRTAARELGWDDAYALCLARDGLSERHVDAAFASVEADTRAAADSLPGPAGPELDAPDAELVERVCEWLRARGAPPDVRVDVAPGGSASRTYAVDPPVDVRVIVAAPTRYRHVRVIAHELGHAAHMVALGAPWWRVAGTPRCVQEAVAEWFADLADAGPLAEHVLGWDAARVGALCRERRRARERWARLQLARAELERRLYRTDDDPVRAWAEIAARYVPARSPELRGSDHWWSDPGTQASYLVGERIRRRLAVEASTVQEVLARAACYGTSLAQLDAAAV